MHDVTPTTANYVKITMQLFVADAVQTFENYALIVFVFIFIFLFYFYYLF